MTEERVEYLTVTENGIEPACFNCESGRLQPGEFGRYCSSCGTYLPTGDAAKAADNYFNALDIGDEPRAAQILTALRWCKRETVESLAG